MCTLMGMCPTEHNMSQLMSILDAWLAKNGPGTNSGRFIGGNMIEFVTELRDRCEHWVSIQPDLLAYRYKREQAARKVLQEPSEENTKVYLDLLEAEDNFRYFGG